jgi:hypothetical protein
MTAINLRIVYRFPLRIDGRSRAMRLVTGKPELPIVRQQQANH